MFYKVDLSRQQELKDALDTLESLFGGRCFYGDMLISLWKNLSFLADEKFVDAFNSSVTNDQEDSLVWRLHTLTWAAKNALQIDGDFVECGVLKGFSSKVIFKYLDFNTVSRRAYLYDTFEGLPEETSTPKERAIWDYTPYDPELLYKEVCETFSIYKNVEIVRGIVPNSFAIAAPEKIAFLHIDMNSAQAEILALDHLFDKVSPGGYIVLDDFGWDVSRDQTIAELEFMKARGHSVLELPTGQGLIIKHS